MGEWGTPTGQPDSSFPLSRPDGKRTWSRARFLRLAAGAMVTSVVGAGLTRSVEAMSVGDGGGSSSNAPQTPTPGNAPAAGVTPTVTPAPATGTLPWIKSDGRSRFVDSTGTLLYLRGFVTITNNTDMSYQDYSLADYQQMKRLGANAQSVRMALGSIGFTNGGQADPAYLARLSSMVNLAKQAGLYTVFKLTVYDVPAFTGRSSDSTWTGLWENSDNLQTFVARCWQNVWKLFLNEPAVIGYDLFNEPQMGTLQVSDPTFVRQYLNPFYQYLIDQLQAMDPNHIGIFQPPFVATNQTYLRYAATVNRRNVAFGPHYYPNYHNYLGNNDYSLTDYDALLQQYLDDAANNQAPILMGEYAMPWNPANDGNQSIQQQYQVLEKAATNRFITNNLSYLRPWYADDKAGVQVGSYVLNHALIEGTTGLQGPLRTFITDIFTQAVTTNQPVT
jgi:hypothetical protein